MGYDLERFENDLAQELICSICEQVLEQPVECNKCQHSFCKGCITEWMSRGGKCPNQCENSQIQDAHRLIKSLIGNLQMKCKYLKCNQQFPLAKITQHEQECEFQLVECIFQPCKYLTIKKEIQDHQLHCEHRKIPCKNCEFEISASEMKDHNCIKFLKQRIEKLEKALEDNNIQVFKDYTKMFSFESKFPGNFEVHSNIRCDGCKMFPIKSIRYKCTQCADFDFCLECWTNQSHEHPREAFLVMDPFDTAVIRSLKRLKIF